MASKISSTLTPDQQQIFQRHIATGQNELTLQLNRYEFQESNRLQDEIHSNALDQAVSSASLGWRDQVVLGKSRADGKAAIQMDTRLSEPQKEIQTRAFLARMDGAVIDSMLADNNSAAAMKYFTSQRDEIIAYNPKVADEMEKNIRAGQVQDMTNSVLSAYRSNLDAGAGAMRDLGKSGLTPEQQSQVIAGVERGRADYAQQVRQDPSVRNQLTALDSRIAQGQTLPTDVGTVDALWRKGAYTDDQRLLARDSVLRAQKTGSQNQEDVAYVRDAYEKGTPLDPKDDARKVNLYFAEQTTGMAPGTPGYNQSALAITQRVGVMPSAVEHYARSALVGGAPDDAAEAAQLLDSVGRVNPRALEEGTDAKTRAMANSISQSVRAGAGAEGAVTMARDNASMGETQRKLLDEMWNRQRPAKTLWDTYDANLIRSGLGSDEHYTTPGTLWGRDASSVPQIPTSMVADFQGLTRDYFYHTGGNLLAAQQNALRDIKGVWGISEVNGGRQLMKYAPERLFPGLTADAIRFDLDKEGYGGARLLESPLTGPSGGREWFLGEPDKWGAYATVMGDDGRPVRYQLPKGEQPNFDKQLQEYDDEQRLRSQRQRENYAAEHPVRQPGF